MTEAERRWFVEACELHSITTRQELEHFLSIDPKTAHDETVRDIWRQRFLAAVPTLQ